MPYARDAKGKWIKGPDGQKIFYGGFASYFGQEVVRTPRAYALIQPPYPNQEPAEPVISSIGTCRTIELWKEPGSENVKIIASSTPEDLPLFMRELGSSMKSTIIEETRPEWSRHASSLIAQGWQMWMWDVEQMHGLVGTFYSSPRQPQTLVDSLIRALKGETRGAWIEICWKNYNYAPYIESASMVIQRVVQEINKGREVTSASIDPGGLISSMLGKGMGGGIKQQKKTAPHELAGSTWHVHGQEIATQYFEKGQRPGIIVSIRGIIVDKTPPEQIHGVFANVKMDYDYLAPAYYPDYRFFDWMKAREIPDPEPVLKLQAQTGGIGEWGVERELAPCLFATPEELPVLIHLPQDPALMGVVQYTRQGGLPSPQARPSTKPGIQLGEHWKLAYDDFTRHMYVIGKTGTGKTNLLSLIMKELVRANESHEFPNAFIYVDPKGPDSLKMLDMLAAMGKLDATHVTFLDPNMTGFALNLLELPPCAEEEKERVRSVYMGFVLALIQEWYGSTPETAPRMLRIFASLLTYLYTLRDDPTLIDLYDLTLRLQDKDERVKVLEDVAITMPDDADILRREIEAIASLKGEAFDPVLTRLADFVRDPFLKRIFCVRSSTINFATLLQPGHVTILRACEDVGAHIAPLIRAMFVLKLWFAVKERESNPPEGGITPVILGVDEFEDLKNLDVIDVMLSKARSAGLGLILAHQNTAQLDAELAEIIRGNVSTFALLRVGPDDAQRLSKMDLMFYKEIAQTILTQPDGSACILERQAPGQEPYPPYQDRIRLAATDAELAPYVAQRVAFIKQMKEMYGVVTIAKSIFADSNQERDAWKTFLPAGMPFPTEDAWKVLTSLERLQASNEKFAKNGVGITDLCIDAGLQRPDVRHPETAQLLEDMGSHGKKWIRIQQSKSVGAAVINYYGLTELGKEMLACDYTTVTGPKASPEAIQVVTNIASHARQWRISHGYFFTLARQDPNMKRKVDGVAYDYRNQRSIGEEFEGPNHVATHAEQVKAHMMAIDPFDELAIWIMPESREKVLELRKSLPEDQQARIHVFLIDGDRVKMVV